MKLHSLNDYLALRRRATELYDQGHQQKWIAEVLGITPTTISRWLRAYRKDGEASIRHLPMGGSSSMLSVEQETKLVELLKHGAIAHGFEGDYWTCPRIVDLIENEFAVTYRPRSVGFLLKRLGFSYQVAAKKHYKQDEAKVQEWLSKELPDLKKKQNKKM